MLKMSVNPNEGVFIVFVFINELQKVLTFASEYYPRRDC